MDLSTHLNRPETSQVQPLSPSKIPRPVSYRSTFVDIPFSPVQHKVFRVTTPDKLNQARKTIAGQTNDVRSSSTIMVNLNLRSNSDDKEFDIPAAKAPVTPPRSRSRLPQRVSISSKGSSSPSSTTGLLTPSPKSCKTVLTSPTSGEFTTSTASYSPEETSPTQLRPLPLPLAHMRAQSRLHPSGTTGSTTGSTRINHSHDALFNPKPVTQKKQGLRSLRLTTMVVEQTHINSTSSKAMKPLPQLPQAHRNKLQILLPVRVELPSQPSGTPGSSRLPSAGSMKLVATRDAEVVILKPPPETPTITRTHVRISTTPITSPSTNSTNANANANLTIPGKTPTPTLLQPLHRALHAAPLASSGLSSTPTTTASAKPSSIPISTNKPKTTPTCVLASPPRQGLEILRGSHDVGARCGLMDAKRALEAVREALRFCEGHCGRVGL